MDDPRLSTRSIPPEYTPQSAKKTPHGIEQGFAGGRNDVSFFFFFYNHRAQFALCPTKTQSKYNEVIFHLFDYNDVVSDNTTLYQLAQ